MARKNLKAIKKDLEEIIPVINKLKSERLQLKLIELVFGNDNGTGETDAAEAPAPRRGRSASGKKSPRRRNRKKGATKMLNALLDEGFFKKPRTIGDVLAHVRKAHNTTLSQVEFSGPLLKMTKDKRLARSKKGNEPFRYTQA